MALLNAFVFYLIFSLFAPLGLIVKLKIFKSPRLIYFSSKLLGLLFFTYVIWLLASAGILKSSNTIVILIFFIVLITSASIWLYKNKKKYKELKDLTPIFILKTEIVALGIYFIFLALRALNPDAYGIESFMDMSLLTSSGKAENLPFADPWYGNENVNYYYYGFFIFSTLAKISFVPFNIAYTLAFAVIFTSSMMLMYNFLRSLKVSKFFAFAGLFLIFYTGSIGTLICTITGGGWNCTGINGLFEGRGYAVETPAFTILNGNLHPQFIDIPFFILSLTLLYEFFRNTRNSWLLNFTLTFALATNFMINSWNFIILLGLLNVIVFYKIIVLNIHRKKIHTRNLLKKNIPVISVLLLAVLMPFIIYLPFHLHFKSPLLGIDFVHAYPDRAEVAVFPQSIRALIKTWGLFMLIFSIFVTGFFLMLRRKGNISFRLFKTSRLNFILICGLYIFAVIFLIEFVYLKDAHAIYLPTYFKFNTTLKFGLPSWIVLGIVSAFAIEFIYNIVVKKFLKYQNALLLLIILGLIPFGSYFILSFKAKYINESPGHYTLDAQYFIKKKSTGDYNAIIWINESLEGRNVILEAAGEPYTFYGRIGVFTGNINPVNWMEHEYGWRANKSRLNTSKSDPIEKLGVGFLDKAAIDVRDLYETANLEEALNLIEKYGIKYVYIGDLERESYAVNEGKFEKIGENIYDQNEVVIYQISRRTEN